MRDLLRIHGGSIDVSSELGKGSTFRVLLPAARVCPREEALARPQMPQSDLPYARLESEGLHAVAPDSGGEAAALAAEGSATVLIVDDSEETRRYIRAGIGSRYRVVEARDGEEGLQKAREHVPDLVLSDVMMPKMDGYALCRALRAEQRLSLIPVILLTARAAPEMAVAGLDCGALDYITKPFTFDILLAKMRVLLERDARQERMALHDALTGVLTRSAWEQEAERELGRIARSGGAAGLAFLDLDDFKSVNDRYGHPTGDHVLVQLAATAARLLRASDIVGRYGGEEFVLLLPESTGEAAAGSVRRVLEVFRNTTIGEQGIRATFSAGVVGAVGREGGLGDLVARADAAMYEAKRLGKNRVCLWSAAIPDRR